MIGKEFGMSNRMKGNVALLFTAIVWGTGFIAQKMGGEAMPPMTFNATRQALAALVLCPALIISLKKSGYMSSKKYTKEVLADRRKHMIKAFFVCGFCLTAATTLQQVGIQTVSAGKSGFITSLYIVMVPVVAMVFGQKLHLKTVFSIAIAVTGFALLSLKGGLGGATIGDWLTLASAFGFTCQILAVNHFVDDDNGLFISVLQMGFCGIFCLPVVMMIEQPTMAQMISGAPAYFYSALVPTALGFTFQIIGQKYTNSTTASLLMSLEAVFAAIFGVILLSEMMTFREMSGCILIFAATILDQIDINELINRKNTGKNNI